MPLVRVAYANASTYAVISLSVREGTSVWEVIQKSGILEQFPEVSLEGVCSGQYRVGVFGTQVAYDHLVSEGDRVEIYHPLSFDPKARRREQKGAS